MLSGTRTFIPTSEGREAKAGIVRGVLVETATHKLVGKLRVSNNQLVTDTLDLGSGTGPLVAAFSGSQQELAFFGERDAAGTVLQQIRVYDFDLGAFTIRRLLTEEQRLFEPVAVTYSVQQEGYIVLDRASADGATMRLMRVGRGGVPELLASWPRSGAFTNFGITTSPAGHIILSSWNASAHNVARLEIAQDGLQLLVLASGAGSLVAPAYAGMDGLFRWTNAATTPSVLPEGTGSVRLDRALLAQAF